MKIMVIVPGFAPPPELIQARERYYKPLCSPDTEVEVVPAEEGPAPSGPITEGLLVPGMLKRVEQAIKEGYDAIFMHCGCDTGLMDAKSLADIPVVGGLETGLYMASMLADRFGLITSTKGVAAGTARAVKNYGIADQIVSIEILDMPYNEYLQRRDEVESKFVELAKKQIDHGAQLIVPSELLILVALGPGSAKRLSQKLGVTVLDINAIDFKTAEMLASLKVSQSKLAFPTL